MDQKERRLSRTLGRRVIPAVTAIVVLSFVLMAGLLVHIAHQQDRHAAEQASDFAQAALERRRVQMARELKDYAAWGEAYQHLHVSMDVDWAYDQRNVAGTLFTDFGYEDVFVVGPAGTVTYAVVEGKLAASVPPELTGSGVDALVRDARAAASGEATPVVGFLTGRGVPLLAAASVITTGGDRTIVPTAGPQSVLVFVDWLTPERLDQIGSRAFVRAFRTVRDDAEMEAGRSLAVRTADGTGTVSLLWDPERPGSALLRTILPWLVLAGTAFIAMTVLILRRTRGAALLGEANARALADVHRQMEHAALHDPLTRLANRAMLSRYLTGGFAEAGRPGAVVYVDLDRFKPINDAFGHRAGDHVLQEIANRLRGVAREGDLVARVGGDEFVLALKGLNSRGDVERICARLLDGMRAPIEVEGTTAQVGLSMGIAFGSADAVDPEALLRDADLAMYEAKIGGGNGYRFFSAGTDRRKRARLDLDTDLRRAFAADEFVLHFQPRYDTVSMRLTGVEALPGWNHPAHGLLGPGEFMTVAETAGLAVEFGAWVLRRACQAVAAHPEVAVSVNVSPVQFQGARLVGDVAAALRESGLPGQRLELELTETVPLENVSLVHDTMTRLKALGVRLTLDAFGTGPSPLGSIRRLPFDRLKIGRQLTADLQTTGDARAIVQAILGLARALKLSVTAQGVETPEQLMLLRADHCEDVQGCHLSRPVAVDALAGLLDLSCREAIRTPPPRPDEAHIDHRATR